MTPIVIEEISTEDFNRIFAAPGSPEFERKCGVCTGDCVFSYVDDEG